MYSGNYVILINYYIRTSTKDLILEDIEEMFLYTGSCVRVDNYAGFVQKIIIVVMICVRILREN